MRPIITTGAEPGRGDLMKGQSLAPAVEELWQTWEIHSMILVGLFLQVFLFLFSGKRMRSNKTLGHIVLWLAYLSADSVATFVLGHLAVRAIEPSDQGLMSFWAPFALVHLGGQETMTAFSMQDNELWKRHLLNLVIQAAVAGYVVGKASWPDRRLKMALVLVFVSGFCKYALRTMYLYLARPNFLKSKFAWKLYGQGKTSYEDNRERAINDMEGVLYGSLCKGSTERPLFRESFSLTTDIMAGDAPLNTVRSITLAETGKLPGMLDKFLSRDDHHNAYEYVGTLLAQCYSRLYTKGFVREQLAGFTLCQRKEGPTTSFGSLKSLRTRTIIFEIYFSGSLFPYVAMPIALVLFATAEKGDPLLHSSRGRVDIMVSYLLLVGAIVLDVSSVVSFFFSRFSSKCCSKKKLWSQKLNQYNMINSAEVSNKFVRYIWEKCGYEHDADLSMPIKKFILDTLLVSGTRKEWNIASTRGQLALHHRKATTSTLRALEESVRTGVDFPRSVLIWHIATDICFRYSGDKDAATTYSADGLLKKHCYKQMSKELSNYIMYLVFKCGVMLTTYSHVVHDETLYEIAKKLSPYRGNCVNPGDLKDAVITKVLLSEEIKMEREESKEQVEISKVEHEGESNEEEERDEIVQLEHEESANDDNNDAAAEDHMKKLCQSAEALYSSPVLPRAREVAQELISIKDEAERWDLIAAVWAEMLYYTAPRCGAAFHAEHLAKGGEFVTHVFVLMYLLGPFLPPPGA
ncbi:hypothetical protein SETIT_8G038000v2 [Setaria italica]|uniref:DUF4220 domain-containing protein n=1 Tax=Setaria italica TaxID=4555 RepID=A0A368S461_SETIT|nr:uncharacterized protein LOC101765363 isoform X1 [Setaria italica]RCV37124.1 hypothetical protein SETIT_8G038000v2 [Setaria italica]